MRAAAILCLLSLALGLLPGCPQEDDQQAEPAQQYNPSEPLPDEGALLTYGKLRLGMSEFDISQVYNAPKGRGEGFWRVVDHFGDVSIHTITVETAQDEASRKIFAQFYRDRLYRIVDRRDGINLEQAEAWWGELIAAYGPATSEPLAGTQWEWDQDGLSMSFLQDNSSDTFMSARLLLAHNPTVTAAQTYLETWQAAHPDYEYPEY